MRISTKKQYGKPRILHVINSLDIGGAEQQLQQFLVRASRETSMKLHALTLFGGCHIVNLEKSGIKIIDLNLTRKYSLTAPWKIMRIIKKNQYAMVVAQLSPTVFYVALASLFLPHVKYISRETSISTRRRKYRIFKILERIMYSRYDKVICVDQRVQEELVRWMPHVKHKTVTFKKGIILPEPRKEMERYIDLIFVGRIVANKGIDVLLKAVAKLKPGLLVKKVVIVGDGQQTTHLKRMTAELALSGIVEFLGKRNDVETLLQQSRLFVLPSRIEGTPSALIEAMSCGTPVVATAVGGVPLVIENGVDGLLVPPDNIDALSKAIEKTLRKKAFARKLARNARLKVVRDYSIEEYSRRMLVLYNNVLESV
jgi:glycosyltransferase involved in cell wall biosynthesis